MPDTGFIKRNLALVAGLVLPVLLMGFFFIASMLPRAVSDPPKYDMVFAAQDYTGGNTLPVSVNFIVKDGALKAQYARLNPPGNYGQWRKLYIYEAKTQKVRELPFGFPADMDKITGTREDVVEAAKELKLDSTLQSPDGYELSYDGYSHSSLVSDLFFYRGGYGSEPLLRKGGSSVRLSMDGARAPFYYGQVQFIGWVKP
jgi:hypothetical protein